MQGSAVEVGVGRQITLVCVMPMCLLVLEEADVVKKQGEQQKRMGMSYNFFRAATEGGGG